MRDGPERRSTAELIAAARRARTDGRPFGFCVANAIESELGIRAGGWNVANLPSSLSIERAVGALLALTRGATFVRPHVEELFEVSLYVAGPGDAIDVYAFYCGPSGLALGLPTDLVDPHPFDAEVVAERLADALADVEPVDWCVRAASDFGKGAIGLRGGERIGRGVPAPDPCRVPTAWDPRAFERACAAAEAATSVDGETSARLFVDVHVADLVAARTTDADETRASDARKRRRERIAERLWPPAFSWVEAALDALPPGAALSADLEHAAMAIASAEAPRAAFAAVGRARAEAIYERLRDRQRAMLGALVGSARGA